MLVSLGRQAWHDQRVPLTSRPVLLRILRAFLGAVTALALLAACSVRLDTPPAEIPTPGPVQQVRADLAAATHELIGQAQAAAAQSDGALAQELTALAGASRQHLAALGGLWTPPPRPDTPTPEPTRTATSATAQDVVSLLDRMTDADALADTLETADLPARTATLIASITLYRHAALARLRHDLGDDAPDSPQLLQLPDHLSGDVGPLCRTLDGLGYAYEVRAARSQGQQRSTATDRAQHYRAAAEQVAQAAGIDGTTSDPRSASYQLGDDLADTIASWQAELVPAWLALIGPADPSARAALLAWAQRAAGHTRLAEDDPFPGLQDA